MPNPVTTPEQTGPQPQSCGPTTLAAINHLIEELGLKPANVAKLELTPRQIVATVYKLRDDGAKYIEPDTGNAAKEVRVFEINHTAA